MKNLKSIVASHFALFLLPTLLFASAKYTPGEYVIDESHSKIGFEVPHMVISSVEGNFNTFNGEIFMAENLKKSNVHVTIQVASIDTGNKNRDEHLNSGDFFKAETYPTITFKSKSISGTEEDLQVKGDLTLKGVTQEVVLKGKYKGSVLNGKKIPTIAFEATTEISRKSFGLTYNKLIEAGPAIGDKVTLSLKVEANKKEL